MKRKFTAFAASIAASISILGNTFSVQAATVDDVASVARSLGVSESVIQQGYNEYYKNPDKYTSQDFDNAISCLYLYEEDLDDMIAQYFGVPNNNNNNSTTQPATTAPPNQTKPSDASAGNSNDNANNNKTPENSNPSNNERPIKQSDFINMTMQEKIDFVNSLPENERQNFIANLTNEERNSILKQLSADEKISILSNFVDFGNTMGLNFQIDNITDESLAMSVRNKDGDLVDISTVGVSVEDTGYDYRLFAVIAGSAILLSAFGIYIIAKRLSSSEKSEASNDK